METIGKRIKELRKERKLSQKELAKMLNMAQATISELENNEYEPTANTIRKICILFDISADYLIGIEDIAGTKTEAFTYSDGTHKITHKKEI